MVRKSRIKMVLSTILILSLFLFSQQHSTITAEKEYKYKHDEISSVSYFDLWSPVINLSPGSSVYSIRPYIVTDQSNNVHLIWQDGYDHTGTSGSDHDIFHRFWNETTTSWSSIKLVSTGSNYASEGPKIVVDDSGNLHAVWFNWPNPDSDIFYSFWDIQTQTWTAPVEVEAASTANSLWPDLAYKNGDVFLVWQDLTNILGAGGSYHDLFFKRRFSNGTWSSLELITAESTLTARFPSIFVDDLENVYVSWDDATDYAGAGGGQDVFFKMRDSSTGLWSITEVISTGFTEFAQRSKIVVDKSGNRHIVWFNSTAVRTDDKDRDIFYKMWNATLSSWGGTELVSTESDKLSEVPDIVLDEKGNLHCFWQDDTDYAGAGSGDQDIFYKVRNVDTQNWQNLTVITTGSFQNSWRPTVTIDSQQKIHLVWHNGLKGADIDVYYSYGIDTSTIAELALVEIPTDLVYEVNTTGNSLSWTLQDDNVSTTHYSISRNGTEVKNGSWVSMEAFTLNVDSLELGAYEYILNATDGIGHYVQDTVYVSVVQDLPSTFDWDFITNMAFGFVVAAAVVIGSMAFSGARRK